MRTVARWVKLMIFMGLSLSLTGCEDPQVYGSVGISSGYSSYGGYGGGGPRMRGSISVGGRIF